MTDLSRLGPLRLAPGVNAANVLTYLYVAFAGIALTTFISVIMPYVLNVNLSLPMSEQGRVAGDLVFYGEIVLIVMSSMFGAWSDRFGRRTVLIAGLLLLGGGYVTVGLVSTVPELIAVRSFLAMGIAGVSVMVSAIQVDYPAEESRGKLVGFTGMAIGLGAVMIGVLFTRLPDMYAGAGYGAEDAGLLTMLTMTGLCLFTALLSRLGLVGGLPPHSSASSSTRKLVVEGARAARLNSRILLSYLCAFVGRADLVVVGTFYSLWLTQAGIASGLSAEEAARNAGLMFAVVMTAALLWAPAMGWLNDRVDRTLVMVFALLLALVGYCGMGLITDPLGSWMMPASVVLGIGQISVTLASQTLLGQESPPEVRGAVVGTFSVFGAGGILFVTTTGGRLYDAIAPVAPFVMIGLLNGLLALYGLWLYKTR